MRATAIFALVSGFLGSASLVLADETWTVVADSTMNGNPGFLVRTVETGAPGFTRFLFEEAGLVRYYAEREDGSEVWNVVSGAQYICPATSMNIDDSWRFVDWDAGEVTTATVVAQESATTAAGTFPCYKVDLTLESAPGTAISSFWFSSGVGFIRQVVPFDEQFDLVDFNIVGGSGFFPLFIGNTWEYTSFPLATDRTSWGAIKSTYK